MDEFRWIITSSFLMLLFHFTATTEKYSLAGNEVTLPCETEIGDEDECKSTIWTFGLSKEEVKLFEHGQILVKSDRLSVTANCSLVMKKVTVEDAGYYTCRQFNKLGLHDALVYLSVVSLTEHEDADKVKLICSVSKHGWCGHEVKWLYEGKGVDEDNKDMKTWRSECSVTVTFLPSFLKQKSKLHDVFKCNVTNFYKPKERPLTFSFQSSGVDATTSPTTRNQSEKMTTSEETNSNTQTKQGGWWQIIVVSVGGAALLIIGVVVIRWKKTKVSKRQVDANMRRSFNTAATESGQEASQDTADPEDGVSYASVTYTKKSNSKAQVRADDDDDDDEGHVVIYSTVKASSSSAGDSVDPSSINKPNQ